MKRVYLFFALFLGLATLLQSQNSLQKERIDSLLNLLETNNKMMVSVSINRNNENIYSKATGFRDIDKGIKADAASKYRIGSISKMYTSVIIFQLIDEGKLKLDDLLSSYFPQIPNAQLITIEQLLRHRSGIYNFTNDSLYLSYSTKAHSHDEMLSIIASFEPVFEPGSRAEYSNSNYVLLGYIIEKVSEKDYSTNLNNRIIVPLGLKSTYYGGATDILANESYSYNYEGDKWLKEPETDLSIPGGAGAIVSNPDEINRFVRAIFNGELLSEASKKEMTRLQDNYGCGIFAMPFYDKKGLGHTGGIDGFRSMTAYYPEENIAVSLCSNGSNYSQNEVLIGILSVLFGREYALPTFKTITIEPSILEKYIGLYAAEGFPLKIEITLQNGQLFGQATGQSSFPLEAINETDFKFDAAGIKITFSDEGLSLKQGGMDIKMSKQ